MKKENTSSIFLSVITVILLICAILLLMLAGLSFISAPKNQNTYDFIKDHGSLIAGLVGFIGVAWLVLNQNKETNKILNSNIDAIKVESFESAKQKALDHWFTIESVFSVEYQNEEDFLNSKDIEKIKPSVHFLANFMEKYSYHGSFYVNVISNAITFKRSLSIRHLEFSSSAKEDLAESVYYSYYINNGDKAVHRIPVSMGKFRSPQEFLDKHNEIPETEYISYVRYYICEYLSKRVRYEIYNLTYTGKQSILSELYKK